ncbi:hypothetical protein IPG41_03515 [Candidatus Peregrinibacteria bacterium]|nr:MAG: hypothetical protein IPG41_03515 [Candidatus Peregrinibacteria bacterium]
MSTFKLIIRTPEKEVFNGEIQSLSFDAEDGRVQILPLHAHYTTTLLSSKVKIQEEDRAVEYTARSGMFTFDHKKNEGLLLCLACEEVSETSYKNAAEYLEFLKNELVKGDLSDYEIKYLQGEKLAVEKQVKSK